MVIELNVVFEFKCHTNTSDHLVHKCKVPM